MSLVLPSMYPSLRLQPACGCYAGSGAKDDISQKSSNTLAPSQQLPAASSLSSLDPGLTSSKPWLLSQPSSLIVVPKPEHYFHFEYKLVPGECMTDLDAVTFDHIAKFYTCTGSRALSSWFDDRGMHFTFSIRLVWFFYVLFFMGYLLPSSIS